MKFNEFTLKQLLANTDFLVGYNSTTGAYIRISKEDLIDTLAYPEAEDLDINVQYSANASSWHSTLASGDRYIRLRVNEYNWTAAIGVQSLVYDGETSMEKRTSNQASYTLRDDGKRKVFSVSVKADTAFDLVFDTYEDCGMMVENTGDEDVALSFSASAMDGILGNSTVSIAAAGKVWITMQRVDTSSTKYIIVKSNNL